ncbi:dTDP-4-dehydrorhamnose reductase, partial [Oscillatoria laete-virens NRMC-F 0139]
GAGGRLGTDLVASFGADEFEIFGFNRAELDITDARKLRGVFERIKPDIVINCAAATNVDWCESHREEAFAINAKAPAQLAGLCRLFEAYFIHISTDYVFDGLKGAPYTEDDATKAVSIYGESKIAAEEGVLDRNPDALIARVAWVFGPGKPGFFEYVWKGVQAHGTMQIVSDKASSPTYTRDFAEAIRPIFDLKPSGILHMSNSGGAFWIDYAKEIWRTAQDLGMDVRCGRIEPITLAEMRQFAAVRPPDTRLDTSKYERLTARKLRPWQKAVQAHCMSLAKC